LSRRFWTKEKVISELRRIRKDRTKSSDSVNAAARHLFGSLRAALEEAGLPCGRNGRPIKKWTKELVIHEIRQRATDRKKLRKTSYEDKPLHASARRYFGSWGRAVEAAGISLSEQDYFYSSDEVQLKIVELYERGDSMRLNSHKDKKLKRSVIKHFGTWSRAVKSLGLDAELQRRWTDQKVIDAIRHRWADGRDLARTRFEDPGLVGAASIRFGGWAKALEAAGFEGQFRRKWTDGEILDSIRGLISKDPDASISILDRNLADLARNRFGSLAQAKAEANGTQLIEHWGRRSVISEIKRRYQAGEPSCTKGFGDPKLAKAAWRIFGSWSKAVEAAGLSDQIIVPKPPRYWNENDVIALIRKYHLEGHSFSMMITWKKSLLDAANRFFGSWSNAVHAAGFEMPNRKWSRDVVVAEIQARINSERSLSTYDTDNINLVAAGRRYFGSWKNAIKAAGVKNPKKVKGRIRL
jgi:hypothetical protein